MDRTRYLELLAADGHRLGAVAAQGPGRPVPPCPGWSALDVVAHTAEVYEHKIACIAAGGTQPDPWPPQWPAERDTLEWFTDAHRRLLEVLAATDPLAPSWTWWPEDQTAGFWVRRMAQETAVHRVDVESALDVRTPVDTALAVDGIDEVLTLMLAGDWSDEVQPGSTGTVAVRAADAGGAERGTWLVRLTAQDISVSAGARPADAAIGAPASDLLLWLWGRAPDESLQTDGDPVVVQRLRDRLRLATQ